MHRNCIYIHYNENNGKRGLFERGVVRKLHIYIPIYMYYNILLSGIILYIHYTYIYQNTILCWVIHIFVFIWNGLKMFWCSFIVTFGLAVVK